MIHQEWGLGYVTVSELTVGRASYAAKYCLKKATVPNYYEDGRASEFSLMSRRPGIGVPYMKKVAEEFRMLPWPTPPDVPHVMKLNGKTWPLDPYLREILKRTGVFKQPSVLSSDLDSHTREQDRLAALEVYESATRQEYENRDKIDRAAQRKLVALVKTPTRFAVEEYMAAATPPGDRLSPSLEKALHHPDSGDRNTS